jgi:hypothetical protein
MNFKPMVKTQQAKLQRCTTSRTCHPCHIFLRGKEKGQKLLVHYNRSHIITSMEYFEILQ